jgi:hypothetical protein
MTIGTGLVIVVIVVVIGLLLLLTVLRPRRPRLVNRNRRSGGFRRRRIDAMKARAAADVALIQGKDRRLRPDATADGESKI